MPWSHPMAVAVAELCEISSMLPVEKMQDVNHRVQICSEIIEKLRNVNFNQNSL